MALDSTGTDISSSIVVVDVTPCATGDVCPACAITFAAAGLCQPGAYLYLYRCVAFLMLNPLLCAPLSLTQNALGSFRLQPALLVCVFDLFLSLSLSVQVLCVMATVHLSRHCILCATHAPSHVVTLALTALPKALGSSALLVWQHP